MKWLDREIERNENSEGRNEESDRYYMVLSWIKDEQQSAITYGGQTVTLPDIPQPSANEVTSSEWVAAFGSEKPFLFADNYKFNMLGKVNGVDFAEENYYADGNKFKDEPIKAPEGERLSVDAFYNVTIDSGVDGFYKFDGDYIESLDVDGHVSMVKNGEKYHIYFDNDGEWVDTKTETDDLRDAICSLFYFGYENLTYNSVDKCYDLTDPEILKYYNAEIAHEYFEDGKFVRFTAVMSGIEREMLIIDYGTTVADHPVIEG